MRHTAIPASFYRHLAVWLLVAAGLLSALAPAVSYGIALGRGSAGGMEICTDQGPKLATTTSSSTTTESTSEPESVTFRTHCLLCLAATDIGAPPPQPLCCLLRVLSGAQLVVAWHTLAPSALFAFAPPPRGPPSVF